MTTACQQKALSCGKLKLTSRGPLSKMQSIVKSLEERGFRTDSERSAVGSVSSQMYIITQNIS